VIYGVGSGPQPLVAEAAADRPASRRRVLVGLAAALGADVVVILGVLLAGDDGSPAPRQPPAPTAGSAAVPGLAERAIGEIRAGRPEAAIALLEGDRASAADGAGQLALGHAYAAAGRERDALHAYQRALELEPGLTADRELAANLMVMLHGKSTELAVDAADLLVGRLASEEAAERLAAIASQGPSIEVRHQAMTLAEKHGLADRIDRVASFALDLEQGARCVDRLKAVARLRALGDRRAIPHLDKARIRRSSTPKWKGLNVNACLEEDAEAAIAFLSREGR
jgi:tetratricopeptide (TPR) repeat protein